MDKYCIKLLNKNVPVVTCTSLSLENGQISYNDSQLNNDYHVDTVATFTCNYGYTLSGSESSTCLTSGAWSQKTPNCTQSNEKKIFFLFLLIRVLLNFTLNTMLKLLCASKTAQMATVIPDMAKLNIAKTQFVLHWCK